jgi:hypothetical protein
MLALLGSTATPVAPASLSPLVVDWQRYFTINWQVTQKNGRSLVAGTVLNTSTCGAKRVQLLIDALNSSGGLIDQRVVWLGLDLNAGGHAYFEAPTTASAASHKVSVFAFEVKKDC